AEQAHSCFTFVATLTGARGLHHSRLISPISLIVQPCHKSAGCPVIASRANRSGTVSASGKDERSIMLKKIIMFVLPCLMAGPVMAQEPKITSLMSKDLKEFPGKELLMITVEHAPGGSTPIHVHNAHAMVYVLEGTVVEQVKGGKEVTLKPGQT